MPRNSSGVYSLPAGNPVIDDTAIESDWANSTMSDVANEITASLPRDGSAPMTGPLILSRDAELGQEATTLDQVTAMTAASVAEGSYLPAGAVQAFAMNSVPSGWLQANGQAVSRTTYANLFAVIGTTYGAGLPGGTTFNVPDLRGTFIRGFDDTRGLDPGRAFASNQLPTGTETHYHTGPSHTHHTGNHTLSVAEMPSHTHIVYSGDGGGGSNGPQFGFRLAGGLTSTPAGGNQPHSHGEVSASGTGNTSSVTVGNADTRPHNVAMIYCIKAFGALQTDGLGTMAFQNASAVTISGGTGVFTDLKCSSAPVVDTDVVRLMDITVPTAAEISFAPVGAITATNVQAAIQQLLALV